MKTFLILLTAALLMSGCQSARINGGSILHTSPIGSITNQKQSQDPKQATTLMQDSQRIEEIIIPANSSVVIGTNKFLLSSNSVYRVTITDKVNASEGAAQKNVIGETIAKLASLRWLTYLGALVFLFGVASAFYPPLKAVIGSVTTSAAIAAAGLALIVLPVIVVGHEILILAFALGGAGVYWFGHRHGTLKGELTAVKNLVGVESATTGSVSK